MLPPPHLTGEPGRTVRMSPGRPTRPRVAARLFRKRAPLPVSSPQAVATTTVLVGTGADRKFPAVPLGRR